VVFYKTISNLDQQVAEHFALTVNKLKGKVLLFIAHQRPKGLSVDEAVILGKYNKTNNEPQQTAVMQSNLQTSHSEKAEV
jgi:hypothetical protein